MRRLQNACLILASFFSEGEASPRSGVFVEFGFETGMLETQENSFQKVRKSVERPFVPLGAIQKMGSELFSNADSISKLKFSAKNPIQASFNSANNTILIQNFLPYNLDKVKIKLIDTQGNTHDIGILDALPKQSLMSIPKDIFDSLKGVDLTQAHFEVEVSQLSNTMTQRVFQAIDSINADIFLQYENVSYNPGLYCPNKDCNVEFNKEWAGLYTDLILNMAYVYSTDEWKNAILNAPFEFTNNSSNSEGNDAVPNSQGITSNSQYIVPKEEVIKNFTDTMTIQAHLIKENPQVEGYGAHLSSSSGALAISTNNLLPSNLYSPDYKEIKYALSVILHEYSHTRGYAHNGNMTYPVNGETYDVCATHPNYPNCAKVPAGFVGVTRMVWNDLLQKNALPINYADLKTQQDLLAPSQLATNTLISTISESISAIQSSSKSHKLALVGANFKLGYQQYFNRYFALAYYALVKYNYAKAPMIKQINQIGVGVGAEMLLDFTKSFGIFMGARALYKRYTLLKQSQNTGNIDFVGGINFWGKKSKYSIGVSIPLIPQNLKVSFNHGDIYGNIVLKESASHFNVFFNYGWVF
ncbi:hypothetical protein [Helicobacter cetorum]|uniref:Outer membrane protein HomA n=1 Tax=Helicobacter cetorum (strain ATCC BAA-429 / MIT 00-7128) TaxID=182217 RepID=I0ELU7_HELC0|nr:hypothetical protein [Helicobacter cetorum]AFI03916.1 hypothetical protein HCW_03175 [Helicobacter cetorum MIT 00-7128]